MFSRIGPKLRQLSVDERTLPKIKTCMGLFLSSSRFGLLPFFVRSGKAVLRLPNRVGRLGHRLSERILTMKARPGIPLSPNVGFVLARGEIDRARADTSLNRIKAVFATNPAVIGG